MPHTDERDYYVTMLRGKRVAWLAGPFATHSAALAQVEPAKTIASRLDAWSDFDSFGTASMPRISTNRLGVLNSYLEI